MFRSLIKAFVGNGKIETTKAKAKAISGEIDKIVGITRGKDVVSARRRVMSILANDSKTVDILFKSVSPALVDRKSGFTKITYLPRRLGDAAEMARLEWVVEIKPEEKVKKSKKEGKSKEEKK